MQRTQHCLLLLCNTRLSQWNPLATLSQVANSELCPVNHVCRISGLLLYWILYLYHNIPVNVLKKHYSFPSFAPLIASSIYKEIDQILGNHPNPFCPHEQLEN